MSMGDLPHVHSDLRVKQAWQLWQRNQAAYSNRQTNRLHKHLVFSAHQRYGWKHTQECCAPAGAQQTKYLAQR